MIPRGAQRSIDEREELRHPSVSNTGVIEFRGRKHVVRLINVSKSGAMVLFPNVPTPSSNGPRATRSAPNSPRQFRSRRSRAFPPTAKQARLIGLGARLAARISRSKSNLSESSQPRRASVVRGAERKVRDAVHV